MYNYFNKLVGAQVTGWKGNEMNLSVPAEHLSLSVKFQPLGTTVFDFT